MNDNKNNRIEDVLQTVAAKIGRPSEEIYNSIQEAIDAAWASENLESKVLQNLLFPAGKPTPEEFIVTVAAVL